MNHINTYTTAEEDEAIAKAEEVISINDVTGDLGDYNVTIKNLITVIRRMDSRLYERDKLLAERTREINDLRIKIDIMNDVYPHLSNEAANDLL